MADVLQLLDDPTNAVPPPSSTTVPTQPPFPKAIPTAPTENHVLAPKRQRRPSVRLGEIGDQYEPETHIRRNNNKVMTKPSSKSRPLTTNNGDFHQTLDFDDSILDRRDEFVTIHGFADRKKKDPKPKKASAKRARSNWGNSNREEDDNGFRDFEMESSDSQLIKDRIERARVSHEHDGIELDGIRESNSRDQQYDTATTSADCIRNWLIGLGLGRYAPVFEIHEVDDEVLSLLTLEDLKDMGINAVGSRRKMYAAIQKLGKGFS